MQTKKQLAHRHSYQAKVTIDKTQDAGPRHFRSDFGTSVDFRSFLSGLVLTFPFCLHLHTVPMLSIAMEESPHFLPRSGAMRQFPPHVPLTSLRRGESIPLPTDVKFAAPPLRERDRSVRRETASESADRYLREHGGQVPEDQLPQMTTRPTSMTLPDSHRLQEVRFTTSPLPRASTMPPQGSSLIESFPRLPGTSDHPVGCMGWMTSMLSRIGRACE